MSSIDKFVEGEARKCNPNVRVVNSGGRIRGYIGDVTVFDIPDRHGYINSEETRLVRNGIRAYEEEQKEAEKRERARIEAERVAAIKALRTAVSQTKGALDRSYENAMRTYETAVSEVKLSKMLGEIKGVDVSAFETKIKQLEARMRETASEIDREYNERKEVIRRFEESVSDSLTAIECDQKRQRLKNVGTEIVGVQLPVAEIRRLEAELEKLAASVKSLESELTTLSSISGSTRIREMIASVVSSARSAEIRSLDDIEKVIVEVSRSVADIAEMASREENAENLDRISLLNGIISSCEQLRDYVVEQNYTAVSCRQDIIEVAGAVTRVYVELREADYTTCQDERISQVLSMVQEVLIGDYSDSETLSRLREVFDEGAEYKRDDALQADNYADYVSKTSELLERGCDPARIDAFDPFAYEVQCQKLNEMLYVQDVKEGISKTRTTFVMACKAMEDMGYRPVYCDIGEDDEGEDALAAEAIYAIPGCEGVVWKIIASECGISRSIIGIERTSGATTSVERVMEVAQIIEADGEIEEYFERYRDYDGGTLEVVGAVDTITEGSEEAIKANGCFQLGKVGEQTYNEIMAEATAAQRSKWRSKVAVGMSRPIATAGSDATKQREYRSQATAAAIRARRFGENN